MSTHREPTSPLSPALPSPGLRSGLSFLLFLHLFALAVGVTSSNTQSSQLEIGLRKTPLVRPYLQLLSMDLPYTFNLTFGGNDYQVADAETWIEVELKTTAGEQKFVLPGERLEPRQRFRREEILVGTAATLVGQPTRESVLPAAIADSLVHRYGATGGVIRIVRRDLPAEAFLLPPQTRRTLYEARIIVAGGQVELLKSEAASESAPAATGNGS
ncbi:MAG TPA: hypothetical protein VHY20_07620 [Pirellulales bacterium]|nr:hypothetical protein [Pirellulales bacterium]